jgi:undecaprenyl-diphosphatase
VVSLVGALVLYNAMKVALARPRPPLGVRLMHVGGFAFPSGHATASAAVYAMLAIVLTRRGLGQVAPFVAATIIVAIVGASRIYLGVHWLTDVLGGWALGLAWTSAVAIVVLLLPRAPTRPVTGHAADERRAA